MPLDKCKLHNELQPQLEIDLLPGTAVCFTYMSSVRIYSTAEDRNIVDLRGAVFPILVNHSQPQGQLTLSMFHGRDTVKEDMEDWGYQGPTIQFDTLVIHKDRVLIYHSDDMICQVLQLKEGLLEYEGKFYGDLSVDRLHNGVTTPERLLTERDIKSTEFLLKDGFQRLKQGKPATDQQLAAIGKACMDQIHMDALALLLNGNEWNADLMQEIAALVETSGREVSDARES